MIVVGVTTVSLVLAFLWHRLLLWVGAKIIGSKEGSWKNCAVLTVIGFVIIGVLIGFCALGGDSESFWFTLLCLVTFVSALGILLRVTMHVLNLGFWALCLPLCSHVGIGLVCRLLAG